MSPLLSLLLAAAIFVVGTALVLAWNRWTTARQADGITTFAREMQALAPDRPLDVNGADPEQRADPATDGAPSSDGDQGSPPRPGGMTPGA